MYDYFTNEVMTRLNNPKTGGVMVIGHRLNAEDLFGRLANDGEWKHLVLPLIATRNRRYVFPDGTCWDRAKGELLRPDAFSKADIRRLKKGVAPGFEILQQQNPAPARFRRVKAEHFLTFYPESLGPKGVILSIDPGQGDRSYSVIQAWTMEKGRYALIDQWRAQAPYLKLRHVAFSYLVRYRPSVVLVERNAHGTALIDELADRDGLQVVPITPRENKSDRTKRLLAQVRRYMLMVPEGACWVSDFVEELTQYPNSVNDDQMDAASQAVVWLGRHGPPEPPANRCVGALVTGSQLTGHQPPDGGSGGFVVTTSIPGAALARGYFLRRRY